MVYLKKWTEENIPIIVFINIISTVNVNIWLLYGNEQQKSTMQKKKNKKYIVYVCNNNKNYLYWKYGETQNAFNC